MLPSYFNYIFVHLRQKVRQYMPELSQRFFFNLIQTRPEKPGPTYSSVLHVKTINRYLMKKTAKLPLEQHAKWSCKLKDQSLQWNIPCIDRFRTARLKLNFDLFRSNSIQELL